MRVWFGRCRTRRAGPLFFFQAGNPERHGRPAGRQAPHPRRIPVKASRKSSACILPTWTTDKIHPG